MENDKLKVDDYEKLLNKVVNHLLQKAEIQKEIWEQVRKEYLEQAFKFGTWRLK